MNIKTLTLNNQTIKYLPEQYIVSVYDELRNLNGIYPGFYNWYFNLVVKGLNDASRSIIMKLINNQIIAVAILKDTILEKKVCTLFVKDTFRGSGIGRELMSESMYSLKHSKPIITISSNRMNEFKTLINEFDFKLFKEYKSYYVNGLVEYSFNGLLAENEAEEMIEVI